MSEMKKSKIAFLINDVDTGGTAVSTTMLVKNLDRSKFHVVVVSCGSGPAAASIASHADEYHNLGTGSYPSLRKMKNGKLQEDFLARFRLVKWLVTSIWKLRKLFGKEKIDLIHTNSSQFGLIAGIAGRLAKVPSVWHIRTPQDMAWRRGGPFLVEGYLASWLVTKFIANSYFTEATFHRSWKKKSIVIWNAIDMKSIIKNQHPGELRKIANISSKDRLVGVLGVIEQRKGMDRFINMAAKLSKLQNDVKYVIVGGFVGGELGKMSQAVKDDLVKLSKELGISEKLCFTGKIDNAPYYLGDMDAFFMCSQPDTETFGLVVIEAMAANVPVVAFKNDAMSEIFIDGKTGFLVPDGDVDLAAKYISRILAEDSLAQELKREALNRVENTFDIPILISNIQKLYHNILQTD
jgi:glycosyltransferase involved in cell wall biosynthesis